MQRLHDLAIADSGFVFDPHSGTTFNANTTALELLRGLRDGEALGQLADSLATRYGLPTRDARHEVADFVHYLRSQGLIDEED